MCCVGLDIHGQRGHIAAKALRADVQPVDRAEHILLEPAVKRVGVRLIQRAAQRLFGQLRTQLEIAADPDAQHDGRTGIASREADGLRDKIDHLLRPGRRGHHVQAAHVLAAKALGAGGQRHTVAGNNAGVQHGRGIILRIHAAQRIADHGAAEQALHIAAAHALVHSVLKRATGEVHLLPDLRKHNRHAGILADGQVQPPRGVQIFTQILQNRFSQRIALLLHRAADTALQIAGQLAVRLNKHLAQPVADQGNGNLSHTSHSFFSAPHGGRIEHSHPRTERRKCISRSLRRRREE